jgi:hypothetical protein
MNTAQSPAAPARPPSRISPSTTPADRSIPSRYFNAFRLTTYLLVLYALGHTLGAVIQTPRLGEGSDAVVATMKSVHVVAQGADCTFYGFYRGFGIFVSLFLAFSAVLTWHLGGMTAREQRRFAPVTWALFLSYVGGAAVVWVYFFAAPIAFGTVVPVVLGFACIRNRREAEGEAAA